MRKEYPVIDMLKTGRNIKRIMRIKGFTVKDVQDYLHLGSATGNISLVCGEEHADVG